MPSAFVRVDALPITANGKLDRAALPVPDLTAVSENHVAPRTEQEAALAALWAEVLGVPRVGVHDNFFELGGHSLQAAQLASRLRGMAGREVSLSDVFKASTLEDMARALQRDDIGASVTPLVLRPRAVPVAWSQVEVPFPQDSTLVSLFEAQVGRSPEAVALESVEETLSYGAFNAKASRIAHALRVLGVGPDVRVGLYLERSVDLVAGAVGILKAGGAYVPLDPSYPPARIAYMLEDSGAPVVLTHSALRDSLPDHAGRILCLDRDEDLPATVPAEACLPAPSPSDLAYVIYTSGSTGRP
ncbi:MAG TPA: AMP-binding protein, partial [Methyloversatilis sp.]